MDRDTLIYYSQNASEVFERYESVSGGIADYFIRAFPEPCRILDIGCGSGRDLRTLLSLGHDAYGIEPCSELREKTYEKYPDLKSRITEAGLPDPGYPFGGGFDAIVCSAVLMHLQKENLPDAVAGLKLLLKHSGRALVSVPYTREGVTEERRDDHGRLFSELSAEELERVFAQSGFRLCEKWINEDSLKRQGFSWVTMLFGQTSIP
ncbi:MAG: class I SAM-dependent methyltransferase [Candidatus Wallbacteria bacterium]|nr:class I SAM-dependent methyltransferase [Candidatus Wallbacteria bacterium]